VKENTMASRGRRTGGGIGRMIGNGFWLFVVACIAYAVLGGALTSPRGFYDGLVTKSGEVKTWVGEFLDHADGQIPGPSGGSGDGGASTTTLDALPVASPGAVAYNRDDWRHWDAAGSSCWNVRDEVLFRDAVPGSVTLLDRDKHVTSDKAGACYVEGGTWVDPYTGATFTNPDDLDIDHMVPLGNAALSGGQGWSSDKKRAYANDLQDPHHLVAASASANRSKGDQTPATWRPANEGYWCTYAQAWVGVKSRWALTVSPEEKSALADMLARC
jgi:hypothetical protein